MSNWLTYNFSNNHKRITSYDIINGPKPELTFKQLSTKIRHTEERMIKYTKKANYTKYNAKRKKFLKIASNCERRILELEERILVNV
jgi:hypothetical protein